MDKLRELDIKYRRENIKRFMGLSYDEKLEWSKIRIKEFLTKYPNATVSFSGGKDSSVLLHLVRSIKSDVVAVFSDTGVEYQEIYNHVNNTENVIWKTPIKNQERVWIEDGYPIFSKATSLKIDRILNSKKRKTFGGAIGLYTKIGSIHKLPKQAIPFLDRDFWPFSVSDKCCHYLKVATCGSNVCINEPSFVGMRVEESKTRAQSWVSTGCNVYGKNAKSSPIAIWNDGDIDKYIRENNVPIAKCYKNFGGDFTRTGCKTCPFGVKFETRYLKQNRFEKLKEIEPDYYNNMINNKVFRMSLLYQLIEIRNDREYMEELENVKKIVNEWWANFEINALKIVDQYENRQVNKLSMEEREYIINNLMNYKK